MIDELITDLKRDEGWRPFAYDDASGEPVHKGFELEGYVTIGYGFCIDSEKGSPLPRKVAEYWLGLLVNKRWIDLVTRIPWLVDQPANVQRALGNMAYQLGVSGVLRFQKMLDALGAGDRETAADEALDSKWAKQTPNRAKRVAALIRGD